MWNMHLKRKKEEEAIKKQHDIASAHFVPSSAHKRITAELANSYYNRVEEWMNNEAAKPQQQETKTQEISLAEFNASPYLYYRVRAPDKELGSARMTCSHYIPDRERVAQLETKKQVEDPNRVYQPFTEPLTYRLREREKAKEIAGPFIFKSTTEGERIDQSITARDIGGRAFSYEQPKILPNFRVHDPNKWIAGPFLGRFPPLPAFTPLIHAGAGEPYKDPNDITKTFREINTRLELTSENKDEKAVSPFPFNAVCFPDRRYHDPNKSAGGHNSSVSSGGHSSRSPSPPRSHRATTSHAQSSPRHDKTYWKALATFHYNPSPRISDQAKAETLLKTHALQNLSPRKI